MSMVLDTKKLVLGSQLCISHLVYYDTLFQNAIDIITKCDRYVITKCDKSLLQNASGVLLQNATILLKSETAITKYIDFIKNCGIYYKIRQYSNSSLFSKMIKAHVILTTSFKQALF